jgi:two-component system cell cycle sensor histidine kinase/response regulator CckA
MHQPRILLTDDDAQIRSIVQAILKSRGYRVDEASDGLDALEVLRASGPAVDLLITDIKMPRMDGVTLARRVAQTFPAMTVLFISGWSDPLDGPEWQEPEYAFLAKPFLPQVLANAVEQLLAGVETRAAVPAS